MQPHGEDSYGKYSGSSVIVDAKGKLIGEEQNDKTIAASLSKESLVSFRTKFPVLQESDRFDII